MENWHISKPEVESFNLIRYLISCLILQKNSIKAAQDFAFHYESLKPIERKKTSIFFHDPLAVECLLELLVLINQMIAAEEDAAFKILQTLRAFVRRSPDK